MRTLHKMIIMSLLVFVLAGLMLVGAAEFRSFNNINLQRNSIINASNITSTNLTAMENLKVGNGTEWMAIYANESQGFFNSTLNLIFTNNITVLGVLNASSFIGTLNSSSLNGSQLNVNSSNQSSHWDGLDSPLDITNLLSVEVSGNLNVSANISVLGLNATGESFFRSSLSVVSNFIVNVTDLFVDVALGRVGIGTDSPIAKFHVSGDSYFNGSVNVTGDVNSSSKFWAMGVQVATLNDLTSGNITVTSIVSVRNVQGATINPGDLMQFIGYNTGLARMDVVYVANNESGNHSDCMMLDTVGDNSNGQCVVGGLVVGLDTSGFSNLDDVYLNNTRGGFTDLYPANADCIQKLGMVLRSHASQGVIWINGADRCNDVGSSINMSGSIIANGGNMTGNLSMNGNNISNVIFISFDGDSGIGWNATNSCMYVRGPTGTNYTC